MLVYLKEPMGSVDIEGIPVYGKYYCRGVFGPADVPRRIYEKYKGVLEEIEYNKDIFKRYYSIDAPDINFKLNDFWKAPFDKVVELAHAFGIEYIGRKTNSTTNSLERRGLRKAILRKLNATL